MKLIHAVTIWLLSLSIASASPADALNPLPRRLFEEAQQLEADGELSGAALRYEKVAELAPEFTQALTAWGRCLEGIDDFESAAEVYSKAPYDVDVLEALGRLQLSQGRHELAFETFTTLSRREPTGMNGRMLSIVALAHSSPLNAAKSLVEYSRFPLFSPEDPLFVEAIRAILAEFPTGQDASAVESLLLELPLSEPLDGEIQESFRHLRIRRLARTWARAGVHQLDSDEMAHLDTARRALRSGDVSTASNRIEAFSNEMKRNPEVQAFLSEFYESERDVAESEAAARRAIQFGPGEARYLLRYADLLVRYHAGRFDAEAVEVLRQAFSLKPDSVLIAQRIAELEKQQGNLELALEWYQQVLSLGGSPQQRQVAERFAVDFERPAPSTAPFELESEESGPTLPEARLDLYTAYIYQRPNSGEKSGVSINREADLERALFHLDRALKNEPELVEALNLRGAIFVEQKAYELAAAVYKESLTRNKNQPQIMLALADVERRCGRIERSEQLLVQAADAGAPDAVFQLAKQRYNDWQVFESRRLLEQYFAESRSGLSDERARELEAQVVATLRTSVGVGVVIVFSFVAGMVVMVTRCSKVVSIEEFTRRHPESSSAVLRTIASIRHEVIKHNTSGLVALARDYEELDPDVVDHVFERIFGNDGAIKEFERHFGSLRDLVHMNGLRLDLVGENSCLGALHKAVESLRGLERAFKEPLQAPTLVRLEEIARVINGSAYESLGAFVSSLALTSIDKTFLDETCSASVAPGQEGSVVIDVEFPFDRVWLRVLRDDLRLVILNLCRNAVRLSVQEGSNQVLLSVCVETDFVTGIESICLRFCDRIRQPLTTTMIRSGYIERGLGLAVDAINRSGGTIAVEELAGWEKAISVRFPTVEFENP